MTRQVPRRPASSRAPVSRPRKVAGQPGRRGADAPAGLEPVAPASAEPPSVEPVETAGEADPTSVEPVENADHGPGADEAQPGESGTDPRRGLSALFDSPRATRVLVASAVVLAAAAGALFGYRALADDEEPREPPPEGQIAVPDDRPVLLSGADAQDAVAEAAEAAETIVATSWEDYDEQVDEATALMTDDFAEEYHQAASDIEPEFVEAKTEVEVRIVAQSVVRANTSEVQALLFLNQYVTKNGGETTYTPYRTLVTMVHTERGWLVSDLDTQ